MSMFELDIDRTAGPERGPNLLVRLLRIVLAAIEDLSEPQLRAAVDELVREDLAADLKADFLSGFAAKGTL